MKVKEITLPWPDAALTPHAKGGWWGKARATKEARNMAWAKAMEAPRIDKMPEATIFVEYWPKAFRGDVHNMHGRMKAYIDGIADAMGCDDKRFKVDFPTVWAGRSNPGKVVFRVVPPTVNVPIIGQIIGDRVVK